MLRSIIGRVTGASRGRPGPATGRPTGGHATGGANRDVERGARTLVKGLLRRGRGRGI